MNRTEANAEIERLRTLKLERRKKRFGLNHSRLDRYRSELLTLHQAGGKVAELRLWLREHRIVIAPSTIYRWLAKNAL